VVAVFDPIVSDREGAALAAHLGQPHVVEEDEHLLADRMLAEIERAQAMLVVVGCRGYSRPVGIARGAPTTTLVHEAPCSVLVARDTDAPADWPRTIVAGLNGSDESERAVAVARELAARLDARLYVVTAAGADPVTVLAEESETADLIVVGSRGLPGARQRQRARGARGPLPGPHRPIAGENLRFSPATAPLGVRSYPQGGARSPRCPRRPARRPLGQSRERRSTR
jgi:nucleotide-binding universal stress UspA family protein